MSIPVICDRCRTTGSAGDGDFSHLGDLLEFEPVAVRPRANGWDPDAQRAFIALLATTGSKRSSALAIGRNVHGFEQLLKRPDGAGLKLAFERAMAIYQQNGAMKIATGVADAAARNAQMTPPSRLRGHEPQPEPDIGEDHQLELIEAIGQKFMRKVAAERRARLAGEIVAADFYLRQVTILETMFDLTASRFGWDTHEVLRDLRRGGLDMQQIVATPFTDWLDRSRRLWWMQEGEPERPSYPDTRFLEKRHTPDGEVSVYTDQDATGALTTPARGFTKEQWAQMKHDDQRAARQRQFDEDAEEQRQWEARARAEWEKQPNSSPSSLGEGDHACPERSRRRSRRAKHGGGAA